MLACGSKLPVPASAASVQTQSRRPGRLHVCAAVKRGSDKTVICSKTVVARKGSEEAVQALCQEVMDFSRGEMSDRANGILEYGVNHDMEEKNVFHFFERYSSNGKLGQHNVKPAVKDFMEKLQPHMDEPVGMALYEMKGGHLSNIMMQGGYDTSFGCDIKLTPTCGSPFPSSYIRNGRCQCRVLREGSGGGTGPKGEGGLDDATGAGGSGGGASLKQSSATVDLGKQDRGDGDTAWGMKAPAWIKKVLGKK